MIIQDVIDKALRDPIFAAELQVTARKAQKAGRDTDEWEALMKHFARSREELKILRKLGAPGLLTCTEGTSLTITTTSSIVCMITTTTTTGTFFCNDKPPKKRGSKKR